MSKREPRPCDMKTCQSNGGRGFCGAVNIWVSPDKRGRPLCMTYSPEPDAQLSEYDCDCCIANSLPAHST